MSNDPVARLREISRGLPEATEGITVHHPSLKIRGKAFVMYADHDGPAYWVKAAPGEQGELIAGDPARFFVPPYLGPKGWVGVRLDPDPDWDEITELVTDAYRRSAPKRLVALLDQPTNPR